jgi:hypothetical protein
MRSIPLLLTACVLACAHSSTSDPSSPGAVATNEHPTLPATLTGTVVATDESERVLVVMGNMIATMESEVTSKPDYEWIEDVQCDAPFSCRVTANGCEGTITREANTNLVVAFAPVGGSSEADQVCRSYSGRYAIVDDPLLPEAPNRPRPAGPPESNTMSEAATPTPGKPRGRVVVGQATTTGSVDVESARAAITARTDALEECYARYLLSEDVGRGIVRFSLDHGSASPREPRPVLEESTFEDDAFDGCVLGVVRDTDRLVPSDGKRARVHYVVSFVGR